MGKALQIHDADATPLECQQKVGLARSRAATHHTNRPGLFELSLGPGPVGLVSTGQNHGGQIEQISEPSHAPGAQPSPPAVNPRGVGAPEVLQHRRQHGQFWPRKAQSELNRLQTPLLLVGRPDLGAFFVAEQGDVACPWPMAFGELRRTSNIHHRPLESTKDLDRFMTGICHA